jgi:hypothetical protein
MTALFYITAAVLALLLAGAAFVTMDARRVAGGVRLVGPIVIGGLGAGLLLFGRAGIGGMLLAAAFAWHLSGRTRRPVSRTPGARSTVRTAALEMELDHDTAGLEGIVLAGRFEGRELNTMSMEELIDMLAELSSDGESRQLIETYLDTRFAEWRASAYADAGDGNGAPSGPMSRQEAYQVLGLEPGASTADIRKAHRRLMQRLHPDLGGTSSLAARINEAKDVLLAGDR